MTLFDSAPRIPKSGPRTNKVMLLDPKFSADPIADELSNLGFEVVRVGKSSTGLGRRDETFVSLDYKNYLNVLKAAKHREISLFVPGCTDESLKTWGKLIRRGKSLDFQNRDFEFTLDKLEYYKGCESLGVPVPKTVSLQVAVRDELENVLVKPRVGYSGIGIKRVSVPELRNLAGSPSKHVSFRYVAQEFVEGQLFSVASILERGRVVAYAIVREFGALSPFRVDVSYVEPDSSAWWVQPALMFTERLADYGSIRRGYIHSQIIVGKSEIYFLESSLRMAGDHYPSLLAMSKIAGFVQGYLSGFISSVPVPTMPFSPPAPSPVLRVTHWVPPGASFSKLPMMPGANLTSFEFDRPLGFKNSSQENQRAGVAFFEFDSHDALTTRVSHELAHPEKLAVVAK